jgi:hypothetical protein
MIIEAAPKQKYWSDYDGSLRRDKKKIRERECGFVQRRQ